MKNNILVNQFIHPVWCPYSAQKTVLLGYNTPRVLKKVCEPLPWISFFYTLRVSLLYTLCIEFFIFQKKMKKILSGRTEKTGRQEKANF